MRDFLTATIGMLALITFAIAGFYIAGALQEWESANEYPFGRLCDVYATCQ